MESTEERAEVTATQEIKKIYEQLTIEENKVIELMKHIDDLKEDKAELQRRLDENLMLAKESEAKHYEEIGSQKALAAEKERNGKKEVKQLKDALNASESARGTSNATIKILESKIKELQTDQHVQEVLTTTPKVERELIAELKTTISNLKNSLELEKGQREQNTHEMKNLQITAEENTQKAQKDLEAKEKKLAETMQLVEEKENKITELKECCQFVEASLNEKVNEIESLQRKLKESKKGVRELVRKQWYLDNKTER